MGDYTEADQRADKAFLVGVNYGRADERAQLAALAKDERVRQAVGKAAYERSGGNLWEGEEYWRDRYLDEADAAVAEFLVAVEEQP